jgi:hypothetical protein
MARHRCITRRGVGKMVCLPLLPPYMRTSVLMTNARKVRKMTFLFEQGLGSGKELLTEQMGC